MATSLAALCLEAPPPDAGVQIGPRAGDRVVVQIATAKGDPASAWWDAGRWDQQTWATGDWRWIDITCDVRGIDTDRGRDSPLDRYRVGTAHVILANRDRKYSTTDAPPSSPYVIAGRSILGAGTIGRVGFLCEGSWYPVLTGVAEQWSELPDYGDADNATGVVLLESTSELATVDHLALDNPVGRLDAPSQRLDRLLADAGWRWPTRYYNALAPGLLETTMAGNRLGECYLVADSVKAAAFYADADGAARFDGTGWLPGGVSGSISIAPIPGQLNPTSVLIADDTMRLTNDVSLARVGGSEQRVVDSASRDRFGAFTYQRHDLIASADSDVAGIAVDLVTRRAWDVRRVDAFTLSYPHSVIAPGSPITLVRYMAQAKLRQWTNLVTSSSSYVATIEALRQSIRFGGPVPTWELAVSVIVRDPPGPYS